MQVITIARDVPCHLGFATVLQESDGMLSATVRPKSGPVLNRCVAPDAAAWSEILRGVPTTALEAAKQRRREVVAEESRRNSLARDAAKRARSALLSRVAACTGHRDSQGEGTAVYGYTGSVSVYPYTEENRAAHGGVTYHEVCRCGAERAVNANGCHREYSPWRAPEAANGS